MKNYLAAFIFILFFSLCTSAQIKEFRTDVVISVGGDEALRPQVTSYITRELRALKGVDIVLGESEFQIILIPLELTYSEKNIRTGFALSVVITRRSGLKAFIENNKSIPESTKNALIFHSENDSKIVMNVLKIGSDLQLLCKEVIAAFDGEHLEGERLLRDTLRKKP